MIKQKTHQVIGAKLKYEQYNELEKKCLENRIPISQVIKKAVNEYLKNN